MRPITPSQCGSSSLQTPLRYARQPGTPVGELLARPSSQPASTRFKPQPSQSPGLPIHIFCSDSDSDTAYTATPPLPKQEEKPRPSAAPHLQLAAPASKPAEYSLSLPKEDFGCQINFDSCKQAAQTPAYSSNCRTPGYQPMTRACAKLLVRSALRCSFCFSLKSACLCLKTLNPPSLARHALCCSGASLTAMGQASRFRVGEPVFRFHDSDSDVSSPSVVSVRSAGFAQVWGHDLRFFPSDDEAPLAASSESLSSSLSRPGLRYRHPQPWLPIDIRPRYMYSAGLLATVTIDSRQTRMPMIFQSLEGILFGSQSCAWTLLCLDHHEWLQVVLCNKACHDYIRERASASAIRLPSDPPPTTHRSNIFRRRASVQCSAGMTGQFACH